MSVGAGNVARPVSPGVHPTSFLAKTNRPSRDNDPISFAIDSTRKHEPSRIGKLSEVAFSVRAQLAPSHELASSSTKQAPAMP
jgi:hypothetical protein